jgi:hypothetical protein
MAHVKYSWKIRGEHASERSRRPTLEELDRLMEHFGRVRAQRPSSPLSKPAAEAFVGAVPPRGGLSASRMGQG